MKKSNLISKILVLLVVLLLAAVAVLCGKLFIDRVVSKKTKEIEKTGLAQFNTISEGGTHYRQKSMEHYLIIGLDTFGEITSSEGYYNHDQADYLILASIDKENEKCSFLQINRDTMCPVEHLGVTGEKLGSKVEQIALAHTYGDGLKTSCYNTVDAVSSLLYDLDIDYFITLTMDGFMAVNDYIGGVTIDDVNLLGEDALTYVRARIGVDDGTNIARMERQRNYLSAFIEKMSRTDMDDSYLQKGYKLISDYTLTNADTNKIVEFLENLGEYEFTDITWLPGEADYSGEYVEYHIDEDAVHDLILERYYESY